MGIFHIHFISINTPFRNIDPNVRHGKIIDKRKVFSVSRLIFIFGFLAKVSRIFYTKAKESWSDRKLIAAIFTCSEGCCDGIFIF